MALSLFTGGSKRRRSEPEGATSNVAPHYPLGTPELPDEAKKLYKALMAKKKLVYTLTPKLEDLVEHGIRDSIRDALREAKLSVLLNHGETLQYPKPVYEFLSTFEEICDDRKLLSGWTFMLGGVPVVMTREDLCGLFGFPSDGVIPAFRSDQRDAYWNRIATTPHFCPGLNATHIHDRFARVLHRLVACSMYARSEGARTVTAGELDCMMAIISGVTVDWLRLLTEEIKKWKKLDNSGVTIGGTLFITLLTAQCGFDLSLHQGTLYQLTTRQMVSFGFIGGLGARERLVWKSEKSIKAKLARTIRARLEAEAQELLDADSAEEDDVVESAYDFSTAPIWEPAPAQGASAPAPAPATTRVSPSRPSTSRASSSRAPRSLDDQFEELRDQMSQLYTRQETYHTQWMDGQRQMHDSLSRRIDDWGQWQYQAFTAIAADREIPLPAPPVLYSSGQQYYSQPQDQPPAQQTTYPGFPSTQSADDPQGSVQTPYSDAGFASDLFPEFFPPGPQ